MIIIYRIVCHFLFPQSLILSKFAQFISLIIIELFWLIVYPFSTIYDFYFLPILDSYFFRTIYSKRLLFFSFSHLKKLLQTAIAYLFICDDAFLYPREIQNSESQLHRVMKGKKIYIHIHTFQIRVPVSVL